ncbi:unnamed protein product [Arabis nemorensis]|uniref:Uncharacterized protein n=1 Tax=Arabis nemorensis TaxID=586526 RepID=A0A565BJL2_9BRAS|nr:unnamed protein product [Arabis nemorensis]
MAPNTGSSLLWPLQLNTQAAAAVPDSGLVARALELGIPPRLDYQCTQGTWHYKTKSICTLANLA